MKQVVIIGYGPLGLALTRAVYALKITHQIMGVFVWSTHAKQSHYPPDAYDTEFITYLKKNDIPQIMFKSVNHFQFVQYLKINQPDLLLIGSWGEILKPFVLEVPRIQFINCHPSLLPMHRGPNPYSQVILQGDKKSGITFHQVDRDIDTGPILSQALLPVFDTDTVETLRARCAALAETTLTKLLIDIEKLIPQSQESNKGSYEAVDDTLAWIRWHETSEQMDRRLRATAPWMHHVIQHGKQVFEFRQGRIINHRHNKPAGTILNRTFTAYMISAQEADKVMVLSEPIWYGLPNSLTRLIYYFCLRPGVRLNSPKQP